MSDETAVYGYVRVSTEKQNNEHWKLMIRDYCDGKNLSEPWFREETVSGAKPWKERKLAAVLADMKSGEHLVVGEASRIGRDAADALDFIKAARNAGIIVHVIQAGLVVNGDGVDTAIIILPVLFGMAEYERKLLSYRTKLGLKRAKDSGKVLGGYREGAGRNPGDGTRADKAEIIRAVKAGKSKRGAAAQYGVSRATIYRWLAE